MVANVERPVLPRHLYRYRPLGVYAKDGKTNPILDREISAIKERYVWCSDFRQMNDPMEGFYYPMLGSYPGDEGMIVEIYYKKSTFGIASLSDTKDNELMWAHYAANYSGMCIEYRTKDLIEGLRDGVSLVRLGYGDHPPLMEIGDPSTAVKEILSQKKSSWAYEREWRIMSKPPGRLDITKGCINHIYLGSRVAPEIADSIQEALQGTNISISHMSVDGYEHRWAPQKLQAAEAVCAAAEASPSPGRGSDAAPRASTSNKRQEARRRWAEIARQNAKEVAPALDRAQ